jgi:AraC-like DNA-binding protein
MRLRGTRGILDPMRGLEHFALDREPAPADLRTVIEGFWLVRWDLRGRQSFKQEVLPYPCVNVAFENGRFMVHGPCTSRFVAELSGAGWVLGAKFTPAGFARLARVQLRALVDRVLPIEEAAGIAAKPAESPAAARAAMLEFLAPFAGRDAAVARVNALVDRAQEDRSICCADDLARIARVSVRSLHRLFEKFVGVSPKWVVRRARVQEAADRVVGGARVDWAAIAQELGYHDQAHFIRDFRAQIGDTPTV